jgi:uncharacterized protein YjbI with pentapeptide repeats
MNTNLKKSPIILDYSELKGIKANGLYLPLVRGREAVLWEANLKKTFLLGANLYGAKLVEANLVGAKNLEAALHIEDAIFDETIVTKREKAIIKKALKKKKQLFVVVDKKTPASYFY